MAGPWEQYQQPSAAPAAASSAPDQGPWTQYQPQAQGGILRNIAAGLEEGGTSALQMIGQVANPVFGMLEMASHPITAPFGDKPIISPPDLGALLEPAFRKTGISPGTTTATTVPEKIARGAGQGIVFGAAPVGEAPTMAKLIAQGVIGAAAGGAAYPAQEAVPESVRPAFGPAAAVLAGGAAGAGVAGAEAGARAGAEAVARSAPGKAARTVAAGMGPESVEINIPTAEGGVTPMRTTGAAAREAGAILATRATAPQTMADMIAQGIEKPVPGSQPTTFQATGDMGIGALERDVATRNPELFQQRRAEQNVARTQALSQMQQGGDVGAVTDFLRGQLGSLDQDSQSAVEQAANAARQRVSEMGGAGTPEVYGEQLRGALNEAEAASKARERGLWQAIDPNNELTGNVSTTREAARSIVDEMPKTAKPMGSEEAAIFQAAQDMNRLSPVSDLIELRSRLRAEMSHELMTQGRSPAYARMTQLRQAIQDNLANTISDQVAAEAENVRPGETPPPESLTARLQGWLDDYIAQRQQAGTAPGTAAGGVPGPGPGAGGVAAGTEGAAGGGPGGAAGSEGVPGLAPTFDEAARQRLAAATAATRERAGTFNRGPVALALRRGELQDVFRMPEAQVPQKFFHPGPTGFDDMQALYRAVGQSRAVPMIADYAAMSLRRAAMDENGVLDPAKFNRWRASHADALRALPDEVRQRFADAASAGREVINATEARARALKDFQAGRVSQLLNLTEPEDISRTVGRVFSSPRSRTEMRALVDRVRGDKDAREGLRQAVADFITQRYVSNTEGATSGVNMLRADQFLQFARTQKGALDEVFTPKQVQAIQDIASDLQRSQRSQTAVKLPGQSNTAQDLYSQIAKRGGKPPRTVVGRTVLDGLAALLGLPLGGPAGAIIGGLGAHLLQALHEAGIDRVDELVTQAMLHPEVAEQLLRRAPKELMRTQTEKLAAALAPSGADEQARMQREPAEGASASTPESEMPSPPERPSVPDLGARAERNVGPGLFGTPAERDATYQKLSDAVDKVVSRIAPGAKVEGYARLSDNRGPEAGGAIRGSTFARRTPDGIEHVILWSLESPDAVGTVRHEAIHALRDMGLFTDREWGALERAANERGWLDRYDIERRYPGLSREQHIEEAVAEAFADWRADPKTPVPVGVRSIFQRLADALRGIGTAARRVLGRNVSADDVFHLIDSGRLGRRRPQYAPAFDASVRFARAAGVRRSPRLASGLARALTRSVVASTPAGVSAHRRRAAR